ncbi:MAG: pyridoxal phosphate-dependent aminotransferase [Euryarchaeota archaeon]|nr:pyridoxal phosphate-dependent aminotransferase [Euryarchaeota archaeon]
MASSRVQKIAPSATLQITAKAKAMKAQGIDVIGLGAGEPDSDTPQHIKDALYKAVKEGFVYYTPTQGIPELRKAIAEKLERDNKISYAPDKEIIVTPGAKQALYEAVLAIANPGDEILIPEPCWVSYEPMVQFAEGRPVFIPTYEKDGFRLSGEAVEKKITEKTRAIILNSPNNPTGAVLDGDALKAIADLCIEHGLIAISDEIYEKIIYEAKHVSIASLPGMRERTITVNGFSKTYSMTGWRLGYAAALQEIIEAMNRIQEHSISCPTSFVQKAGIAALQGSQECVAVMVKEFRKRRDAIVKKLNEIPNVTCVKPRGAFYAFANFSAYEKDSLKLTNFLLEKAGVAVIPGAAFGKMGEGFLRLSYATSMENINKAIERMEGALRRLEK